MFKVDKYRVYFKHYPNEKGEIILDFPVTPYKGYTECYIVEEDATGVEISVNSGVAFCSIHDQFLKTTGRKVSLTRALAKFNKFFRAKIWRAYLEASRK